MRRTRKRNVPDAGVRAPGASGSMADSPAGKAGVEAEDGIPARDGIRLGGHGGCPMALRPTGPDHGDRPGGPVRGREPPACKTRAGRMPTGVTRGTLSFYLRVSPPRFPARTRAVCSFGAPRMEALQRLVGQQSFRLKDSLRRRPMPFAAGWGLSCCRHPKPSVNGGVSGWRGKRKRHRNTLEYIRKCTVCAHNATPFRTGLRRMSRTLPKAQRPSARRYRRSAARSMPRRARNAPAYPCARGRTAISRAFSSSGSVMGGEHA